MDELFLKEVNQLLENEVERNRIKWKEGMEKYIESEMMIYSRLFFLSLEKHLGFGKKQYINGLLDYRTTKIENCSEEEKKWLIQQIINKLKSEKTKPIFYDQIAHRKVRDKSDRVRMTVKGARTTHVLFISEEKKEEIINCVIDLIQLHIEKELGINNPKALLLFAERVIFLYESPYVKPFHFLTWLQEKHLKIFFEHEDVEELKVFLKNWYQKKEEKLDFVGSKSDVNTLKEYRYLMKERDKKRTIQQVEGNLKKEIELLKREKMARPSLSKENELKIIKEKLIALQTF
jgi:hypothetical protein